MEPGRNLKKWFLFYIEKTVFPRFSVNEFICVISRIHTESLFEAAGKIMDGRKTENRRNFGNRVFAFLDQNLALFQLQIADILLWCCIDIITEKGLQ